MYYFVCLIKKITRNVFCAIYLRGRL